MTDLIIQGLQCEIKTLRHILEIKESHMDILTKENKQLNEQLNAQQQVIEQQMAHQKSEQQKLQQQIAHQKTFQQMEQQIAHQKSELQQLQQKSEQQKSELQKLQQKSEQQKSEQQQLEQHTAHKKSALLELEQHTAHKKSALLEIEQHIAIQKLEQQRIFQEIEQQKMEQFKVEIIKKTKNKYIFPYTYQGKIINIKITPDAIRTTLHCINIDTNELFTIKRTSEIPILPEIYLIQTANDMLIHLINNYPKFKYMSKCPLTTALIWTCMWLFSNWSFDKAQIDIKYLTKITQEPEFVTFLVNTQEIMHMPEHEFIVLQKFLRALQWEDTDQFTDHINSNSSYAHFVPKIRAASFISISQRMIDTMIHVIGFNCGV